MKAILETRCGCTKEIEVYWLPPDYYRVPLITAMSVLELTSEPSMNDEIQFREFELQPRCPLGPNTAHYLERMP